MGNFIGWAIAALMVTAVACWFLSLVLRFLGWQNSVLWGRNSGWGRARAARRARRR